MWAWRCLYVAVLIAIVSGCDKNDAYRRPTSLDRVNQVEAIIAKREKDLNAFLYLSPTATAIRDAESVDRESSKHLTLHGLTFAVKDNIAVANLPMTFGSRAFRNLVPNRDAAVVRDLRARGAVFIGKTNLDEFATSIWGVSGLGGQTRNLFSARYTPGGSSAGSAVAVGAGMADFALGTDTCASILLPSAYAGIVGMRPSHGLISLDGVLPAYVDQDVVGPMAKDVKTIRRVMQSLAPAHIAPGQTMTTSMPKPRIAVASLNMRYNPNAEGNTQFESVLSSLRTRGFDIVQIDVDVKGLTSSIYRMPMDGRLMQDVIRFLQQYPQSPVQNSEDFLSNKISSNILGPPKGPRSYMAQHALSPPESEVAFSDRKAAMAALRDVFDKAFGVTGASVLLVPTAETLPLKMSDSIVPNVDFEYCQWSAFTGLPAITLPAGYWPESGLPFSVMLLGRAQDDQGLLNAAATIEHHLRSPHH
jgi:Asp-tRNA(Asn)/Glu-tRNA(Gln) amidotransferase A subunit family amidase